MRAALAFLALLLLAPTAGAQRTTPAFLASSIQSESVFDNSGAPWPFLAQINAENYDQGGQGVAFNQPNIGLPNCAAVPAAGQAYRPRDFVNLYTSTDDAVGLQVGCNVPGVYYKYQITVPASPAGPYILSLRVANPSPNASQTTWTALIDSVSVGSATGQTTTNSNTFAVLQIGAPSGFNVTAGQHTLELLAGGVAGVPAGDISWFQAMSGGQTISSIAPTSMQIAFPCSDGTLVTSLAATMAPPTPAFAGTWAESGDSNFRIGVQSPTNGTLVCNGTVQPPATSYTPLVTASQSGIASKSQTITITASVTTGCTPAGSPCPVGVAAPSGFHWNLVRDDEFNQQTHLDTSVWTCGNAISGQSCDQSYPSQYYFNSDGINLQAIEAHSGLTPCATNQNCDAGIGTVDSFCPRFGFWEFSIRYPRGFDGSGDGYHIDTYINNNCSRGSGDYREIASGGETIVGTDPNNIANFYCCFDPGLFYHEFVNVNTNQPVRLSDSFHVFGSWWNNDGLDANGAVNQYMDGAALYTGGRQGDVWGSGGASIIAEEVSCADSSQVYDNGNTCSGTTATSGNPYTLKYFRFWQLAPN